MSDPAFTLFFKSLGYFILPSRHVYRPKKNGCEHKDVEQNGRCAYLAAPKGFARGVLDALAGAIFGEERGLGDTDGPPERGKSSNFLRPS
jgi:hypothetical protein